MNGPREGRQHEEAPADIEVNAEFEAIVISIRFLTCTMSYVQFGFLNVIA